MAGTRRASITHCGRRQWTTLTGPIRLTKYATACRYASTGSWEVGPDQVERQQSPPNDRIPLPYRCHVARCDIVGLRIFVVNSEVQPPAPPPQQREVQPPPPPPQQREVTSPGFVAMARLMPPVLVVHSVDTRTVRSATADHLTHLAISSISRRPSSVSRASVTRLSMIMISRPSGIRR
jgi:hypothetical protein